MELNCVKPDLEGSLKKFKAFLHEEPTFWSVLSDKKNEIVARLDEVKQLRKLQELLEAKINIKEQHISQKISLCENLEELRKFDEDTKEEIENFKSREKEALEERREKEDQIIKVWKSYRLVKHMYEDRLGLQIQTEDDVMVFKFTKISAGDDKRYLVKLKDLNGKMTFVDIVPKLKSRDTLVELLKEKNVQIFLACVWKRFKKLSKIS